MSAAAKARRTDRQLEVLVYEKGPYISYGACGMPYYIAGDIPDPQALIARTPAQMEKQGVRVHLHHEVSAIDAAAHQVTVIDHQAGNERRIDYDKLVIATGARPTVPELPGTNLAGVFSLRPFESGLAIRRYIEEESPKRAVVVGGGYIGVEMAETFRRLGLSVTVVIRSGQVLRTTVDDDVRELVSAELDFHGVIVVRGQPEAIEGNGRVEAVVTPSDRIPCDIVLFGLGASPNTEIAADAGVELGQTGAIATNDAMCTNLPGIYAAGDCAEAFHIVTGQPAYIPLGSTANKQGRVAGENAAGGDARFHGIAGTMVVRCFDQAIATTGLTETAAREMDYDARARLIQDRDIPHYMPGSAPIHIKLVVDDNDGRLLGGQIVGRKGVAKRVDVLAAALHNQMTVDELRRLDLSYAPPYAPVWDPILVAANVTAK
jgi:NADPH-dependent 2,4-dienoyl-CoA reductase/sulfur reductase-like enzyme